MLDAPFTAGHTVHHRRLRSSSRTMTIPENPEVAARPIKRVHRRIPNCQPPVPLSHARLLLSRARQCIELETDWLGRKPSIMDFILNLKSPATNYDDLLIDALDRSRQSCPLHRTNDFTDERSLDTYWADQALIWNGVHSVADVVTHFPVSTERSTAFWISNLDGDLGRACVSLDDTD